MPESGALVIDNDDQRRTTLVEKLRKYGLQRDDACEVDQIHF